MDVTVNDRLLKLGYTLYNQYGPTETTVDALSSKCSRGSVTLGQPVANTCCFIVDRCHNLLPVGAVGELMISGAGVARGYLNRPQLTGEKFSENPFLPGQRWYRTGDLAQWLPGGDILFYGRMDHQVKIRGYRVELGEIENRLMAHPAIKEAVVTAEKKEMTQGRENRFLIAYFVPIDNPDVVDPVQSLGKELKSYLAKLLPFYMVPAHFVPVDKIPRTPSGKVDIQVLKQSGTPLDSGTSFAPLKDNLQRRIAEIWKEILAVEQVGALDNFFDLGGNSLSILQLNRKLREAFKRDIPVIKLFRYPTVSALAAYINSAGADEGMSLTGSSPGRMQKRQVSKDRDMAVIGMACRFPGAGNIHEYWELLKNGIEAISFYHQDELEQFGISEWHIFNEIPLLLI